MKRHCNFASFSAPSACSSHVCPNALSSSRGTRAGGDNLKSVRSPAAARTAGLVSSGPVGPCPQVVPSPQIVPCPSHHPPAHRIARKRSLRPGLRLQAWRARFLLPLPKNLGRAARSSYASRLPKRQGRFQSTSHTVVTRFIMSSLSAYSEGVVTRNYCTTGMNLAAAGKAAWPKVTPAHFSQGAPFVVLLSGGQPWLQRNKPIWWPSGECRVKTRTPAGCDVGCVEQSVVAGISRNPPGTAGCVIVATGKGVPAFALRRKRI